MEYYKSICPQCSHAIFWIGPKTSFVKTIYPKCQRCGTQTTAKEQTLDRESEAGRSYDQAIISALSKIGEKPQGE